ncbi:hypothetical protein D3C85_1650570 [compost metagenome]
MAQTQGQGDIGLLDKTKVQADPEEPFTIGFNLEPLLRTHARAVLRHYGEQYHLLMQNLVMQQVVQQRMRNSIGPGRQEHCRALHTMGRLRTDAVDE